jgi:hypothetical protein
MVEQASGQSCEHNCAVFLLMMLAPGPYIYRSNKKHLPGGGLERAREGQRIGVNPGV